MQAAGPDRLPDPEIVCAAIPEKAGTVSSSWSMRSAGELIDCIRLGCLVA